MSRLADRRAIRSLRVGVVPSTHVLRLSVGLDAARDRIDGELNKYREGKQATCLIQGEWGTGKSNLLSYIREYAAARNYAVAYINLNGYSTPINHPQRFYHKIAADLRVPGTTDRGLAFLLDMSQHTSVRMAAMNWAERGRARSEFCEALCLYYSGDREKGLHILLGNDLSWADYQYKKEKALSRINDLGLFLKNIGVAGLIVQFDELETIEQLWNVSSRKGAYKIFSMIAGMKYVWSLFAATEKFNMRLKDDYEKLQIRDPAIESFYMAYRRLPVLEAPLVDRRLAWTLLQRIEELYCKAYVLDSRPTLNEVLNRWVSMANNNPRRLIRHAIDHLDCCRATNNQHASVITIGASWGNSS